MPFMPDSSSSLISQPPNAVSSLPTGGKPSLVVNLVIWWHSSVQRISAEERIRFTRDLRRAFLTAVRGTNSQADSPAIGPIRMEEMELQRCELHDADDVARFNRLRKERVNAIAERLETDDVVERTLERHNLYLRIDATKQPGHRFIVVPITVAQWDTSND